MNARVAIDALRSFGRLPRGFARLAVLVPFVSGIVVGVVLMRMHLAPAQPPLSPPGDTSAEAGVKMGERNVLARVAPTDGLLALARVSADLPPGMEDFAAESRAGATAAAPLPGSNPTGATRQERAAAPPAGPARPASRPRGFRGALTVRSKPAGAVVHINGRRAGSTPLVLTDQPIGSRAVRITLDGYQTWSAAVRVVANQRTNVMADLGPDPN